MHNILLLAVFFYCHLHSAFQNKLNCAPHENNPFCGIEMALKQETDWLYRHLGMTSGPLR